jgi:twitching motility two-component system response regulator PilG
VSYEEHHHVPVFSASRLAQIEHVSGYRVAKTVFLASRYGPVTVVLPAASRLDLVRVEAVVGPCDLRLATEAEIGAWFKGCQPGTVPPLRLRADQLILMDRSLAHMGQLVFAAGTPEVSIAMRFRDWWRVVRPGVGRFAVPARRPGELDQPPTVLVVEDEADTNELLCHLLERKGFACRGVDHGARALAVASEVRPAAILLDLMLPDMSGFDVYERLQRLGRLARTPVIMVTALDDEGSRQRGRQLGADAYLTKPFRPETLVTELQHALADAWA